MDRIGVVGISWRQAGAEGLEPFTLPVEERAERLPALSAELGARELAYLATCNRVEVAFVMDEPRQIPAVRGRLFAAFTGREPEPGEAERTLRAWAGEGAAEHLLLVAAGLDSARPGETEIVGQFREAYDVARRAGLIGARLELVFEHALRVAARVHRATAIGTGRVSLAEIALERVRERLERTPGPLAVVGVSPMTVRCARELVGRATRIVVVNRTLSRAAELAAEVGGTARTLADFVAEPDAVEAVVTATAAADPVLGRPALERLAAQAPSGEPPLLVDMAVPPDVDPEDAARAGIERIGMNQVIAVAEENRRDRLFELADARMLVDEALIELRRRTAERALAPLLAALQRRYRTTAVEGAERLFRRELRGLGKVEQAAVGRWVETLARRFAHIPTMGLRSLAFEQGTEAVEAFLRGLDDGLARELTATTAGDGPAVPTDEEDR